MTVPLHWDIRSALRQLRYSLRLVFTREITENRFEFPYANGGHRAAEYPARASKRHLLLLLLN